MRGGIGCVYGDEGGKELEKMLVGEKKYRREVVKGVKAEEEEGMKGWKKEREELVEDV